MGRARAASSRLKAPRRGAGLAQRDSWFPPTDACAGIYFATVWGIFRLGYPSRLPPIPIPGANARVKLPPPNAGRQREFPCKDVRLRKLEPLAQGCQPTERRRWQGEEAWDPLGGPLRRTRLAPQGGRWPSPAVSDTLPEPARLVRCAEILPPRFRPTPASFPSARPADGAPSSWS